MAVPRLTIRSSLFVLTGLAALAGACTASRSNRSEETRWPTVLLSSFKQKASLATPADTEARVKLGRMLFYDTRLSANNDVSCATCHDLKAYGVDNLPLSMGHAGQLGARNTPSVYHVGSHSAFFWDGRASSLEEQAESSMRTQAEMAAPDEKKIQATFSAIPEYVALFREAFPGAEQPVSMSTVAQAIASFERTLVTRARFDRFVEGDNDALTLQEKRGFAEFISHGCSSCHTGAALGGASFERLGVHAPYPHQDDEGRFAVTDNEKDKMVFRVPSLRNVEKTAPYFHDGSVATLDEAISRMSNHQIAETLEEDEAKDIVAFLRTLTGEIPAQMAQVPTLPASAAAASSR